MPSYYDLLPQMFGDDPEALKEFERIKALRGNVDESKRLQKLGAVGALATDEGLRGFGDNLFRVGAAQEDRYKEAMSQGYEGLKQTRSRAKEREEEKAWRETQRQDEINYRNQTLALQRQQEARMRENAAESRAIRQAAADRARVAADAAIDARNTATGLKQRAERQGIDRAMASAQENLRTVNQALQHPGRQAATGASGLIAQHLPYTKARDYQSVHNKLLGGAFLEAFNSLKGGGQITEVEGKKATDAITRINTPGLTEAEYEDALNELRNVVTLGIERTRQQGYDIGMYKDLPGLPSGDPRQQQSPFGGMPLDQRLQGYFNNSGGGF